MAFLKRVGSMSALIYSSISSLNRDCNGKQLYTSVSYDRLTIDLCSFSFKRGYISCYSVNNKVIMVTFKYNNNRNLLNGMKLISTPGHRIFCSYRYLLWLRNKVPGSDYLLVLRTSKGFITNYDAIKYRLGGELLLKIYF